MSDPAPTTSLREAIIPLHEAINHYALDYLFIDTCAALGFLNGRENGGSTDDEPEFLNVMASQIRNDPNQTPYCSKNRVIDELKKKKKKNYLHYKDQIEKWGGRLNFVFALIEEDRIIDSKEHSPLPRGNLKAIMDYRKAILSDRREYMEHNTEEEMTQTDYEVFGTALALTLNPEINIGILSNDRHFRWACHDVPYICDCPQLNPKNLVHLIRRESRADNYWVEITNKDL